MGEMRPRVLVFGLDQLQAVAVVDALTEDGYDVTIADSRPAALNLAKSTTPDVILVDLALSVCSCGWNLITELQSRPETSQIPLLVISDPQQAAEDAKPHITDCHVILKPYDVDGLEKCLTAAIGNTPMP